MSEEPTNAAAAERDEPLAGRRLAEARQARNISLQDVANELHLDAPKVTALEQNRFDELGAAVFVKGYLRKYADIVGLPADTVLDDYRHFETAAEALPVVGLRRRPPPRDFPAGALLAVILVLVLIAGGLWAWRSGAFDGLLQSRGPAELAPFAAPPADTDAPDAAGTANASDTATTAAAESDGGAPAAAAPPEATATAGADAGNGEAAAATTEAPPEPVLAAPESGPPPEGQVRLQVTFTGDCWTEVSDAAGDRLYFGLGRAGETASVTGAAPLHLLLGNWENASLTVDGDDFAIPAAARRGETARLTIDGPEAP